MSVNLLTPPQGGSAFQEAMQDVMSDLNLHFIATTSSNITPTASVHRYHIFGRNATCTFCAYNYGEATYNLQGPSNTQKVWVRF
jgi:hypothetical protein